MRYVFLKGVSRAGQDPGTHSFVRLSRDRTFWTKNRRLRLSSETLQKFEIRDAMIHRCIATFASIQIHFHEQWKNCNVDCAKPAAVTTNY
jgi:hypothetical protein